MSDSCTTAKGFETYRVARLLGQDTANFKRQDAGIRASLKPGETLSNRREALIRYFQGAGRLSGGEN